MSDHSVPVLVVVLLVTKLVGFIKGLKVEMQFWMAEGERSS